MYKILIVEDDVVIADGLKTHFEKWDYQVECVTDFKNVMDTFLKFEPQLVLLDLVLLIFQWISLVSGNQKSIEGAGSVHFFG